MNIRVEQVLKSIVKRLFIAGLGISKVKFTTRKKKSLMYRDENIL